MSKFVLTAELQLQAPKNVAQVVRQIQAQLDGVKIDVQMQNARGAVRSINQITSATNEASSAANKMGKSFQASIRRFTALAIATRAVSLFTNTLSSAVKESISFERELVKISQVTGSTMKSLGGLTNTITSLSTSLGVSSTSLLSVSRILAQTGLSAKQTEIALGTLARTELAPTFENITQTAEGAVAILNQFGQGARALEAQLGSLNAVAGQFAVEAGDLVAVIRRTGGVFKSAGGDLNELIALFTSVRSTTRESAESIATGLRTIFTRIQRPKTIDYLKQFGVELVDLNGKFVGPFEAVKRLSKALGGLGEGDITFVQIAEQLGGFRQIGKVLPLLQQFTVAQEALKVAQEGQDSLATDAAKAQAALAVQITKVKEEFLALVRGITDTNTFQVMADTTLKLASALIKLADSLKPVIPLLTAFAAIKVAKGVGGFLGGLTGGVSRGFNAGGPVRAFARGGVVPGSGNSDTVPAMLTPGEFVIKKSSVKKLGAENLQRMNNNKYARGGIVVNPGAIGGFFLNPQQGDPRDFRIPANTKVNITNARVLQRLGKGVETDTDKYFTGLSKKAQMDILGVKTSQRKKFQQVTSTSQLPKGALESKEVKKKLRQKLVRNQAAQPVPLSGSITGYFPGGEDLKANAKVAGAVNRATKRGLISGVKEAAQKVGSGLDSAVPQIGLNQQSLRDAAATLAKDAGAVRTTSGYIFEGMIQALTNAKLGGGTSSFDFNSGSIGRARDGLQQLFSSGDEGISRLVKADAKRSNTRDALLNIVNKIKNDLNVGKLEGMSFSKFAKGGSVGTDTVPALLTPGEFVVNRKSANKIGYGNLNRMNKVGKYAKGGIVQRFASGTGATGAQPSGGGMDFSGLLSSLDALTAAIQQVVVDLETVSTSSVDMGSTQDEAASSMKDNTKTTKDNTKSNKSAAEASNAMFVSFMAVQTGLSLLAPTIDETSGFLDYYRKAVSEFGMQVITAGYLLNSLGAFNADNWKAAMTIGAEATKSLGAGFTAFRQVLNHPIEAINNLAKSVVAATVAENQETLANKAAAVSEAQETLANRAAAASEAQETLANNTSVLGSALVGLGAIVTAVGAAVGIAFAPVTAILIGVGAVAATLMAVFGGLALVAGSQLAGARKERAIEEGDVDEAGKQAELEGGFYASMMGLTQGMILTAKANASANRAMTENERARDKVTDAMDQFKKGIITLEGAMQAGASAIQAATQARIYADQAIAESTKRAQGALDSWVRWLLSWVTLGYVDTGQDIAAAEEVKQKDLRAAANAQQSQAVSTMQPVVNAMMRQVAAAGGSVEDFMTRLRATNEALYQMYKSLDRIPELIQSFENLQKEIERTRKAFQALNLGLRSMLGAALAMEAMADNLMEGQDGDTPLLDATIRNLQASITEAAESMDPRVMAASLEQAADAMRMLGATDEQIKKFTENMEGIQQAQRTFADSTNDARRQLLADLGNINGKATDANIRSKIADAVIGNLGPGIGEDVKKRIRDALEGQEFSEKDVEKMLGGDVSPLADILTDLGETTLEQVIPAFEALSGVIGKVLKIQSEMVALEQKLIAAQQKRLDIELEARQYEEDFGGRKVSPAERRANILGKANIRGDAMGLPRLKTGSAEEFQQRLAIAKQQQQANIETRVAAAGPEGDAKTQAARLRVNSMEFKESEANLKKFFDEDLNTRRALLDQIKEEIKAVEAKTTAEKKAAEALLSGTYEQFVEEMAAMGALAAAQTGDPRLMSEFSRTDYGRASKNIGEMRDAGVTSIDGIDIDDVDVSVRSAGLRAGGLNAATADRFARLGVGNRNPETQGLRDEGMALAATLPSVQDGNIEAIKGEIEVRRELIRTLLTESAAMSARAKETATQREAQDKETQADIEAQRKKMETTGDIEKASTTSDNCCDGVSKVEVTNSGDMTDNVVSGLQDVVQALRVFNFIKRLLDFFRKPPPTPDTLRLPEVDKPRLPETDKPRLTGPEPDKPRLTGPETPRDPDFTVRDPDTLRIPGPDRAPTIPLSGPETKGLPGPAQRRLPAPQQPRLVGPEPPPSPNFTLIEPESRTMIDPNAGNKPRRTIDAPLNLPGPQQPRLTGPEQLKLPGPAPEATPVLKGETIPGKQTNIPNKTPQSNKPTSITPYQPPVIDATNVEVVKSADAAEDASKGFKIFDKLKDGLSGFGTGLMKGVKGTLRVLDILDPYLMLADYGIGMYKGATAKEGDRPGQQARSVDKGLDEQSTAWKMFTGATTGDPRMGGSIINDYLIGAETGSNLDVGLAGFEAVGRGAMDGTTIAGRYNPALIPAGAVAGAAYGGGAEIAKAMAFLKQDMDELAKAEEKTKRMREASIDESGLDVEQRNNIENEARIQLDLEEAKKSGDSDRVAELEKRLAEEKTARKNRLEDRAGRDLDATGLSGTRTFPITRSFNTMSPQEIEKTEADQAAYLNKELEAQKEERAAQAKVDQRKKELKAAQQKSIQDNYFSPLIPEAASQATTGKFDYRTGAQLTTGDTGLGLSRPEEEGARTGFAQRVARSAINVSRPEPAAERLPTAYDIDAMTLPQTAPAETQVAAQKVVIDAPLAPGEGVEDAPASSATPSRQALLIPQQDAFDPFSEGTATGKYDINTRKERLNPLLPSEDAKKDKAMDKVATSQKELQKEVAKASSDESAPSSMSGNDQIVRLLAAILQQLKDCCAGGGDGGSESASNIFDFQKTYPSTAGGGSIPTNEQFHNRRKRATLPKTIQEPYPTQDDSSVIANEASKAARGQRGLGLKKKRQVDAIKKLPPAFHVDSPLTQSEDIRAQGGPKNTAPGFMTNMASAGMVQSRAGSELSAGITAPLPPEGSALTPSLPPIPSRTRDDGSLGLGTQLQSSNSLSASTGSSVSGYTGGNTSGAMELGGMVSLLTSMTQLLQSVDQKTVKPTTGQNSNARSQDNAGVGGDVNELTQSLSSVFSTFNSDFSTIVQRLENVSIQIQIAPVQVNIDLNGGGILQSIRQYVSEELWDGIQKEISQYTMGPNGKLQKSTSTLPSGFGSN